MKKWEILNKLKIPASPAGGENGKFKSEEIIKILLRNRSIKTKKEIKDFLNPKLSDINSESVKIERRELKKALQRIEKAIKSKEKIIIYGDYDVDGICAAARSEEHTSELQSRLHLVC